MNICLNTDKVIYKICFYYWKSLFNLIQTYKRRELNIAIWSLASYVIFVVAKAKFKDRNICICSKAKFKIRNIEHESQLK